MADNDDYGSDGGNMSVDDNQQIGPQSYGDSSDESQNSKDPFKSQSGESGGNNQGQNDLDQNSDAGESVSVQSEQPNYQVILDDQNAPDKPNQIRITSPFMTKYQKARIIGVRAVQISKNSPLYLTADSSSLMNWDPLTIAQKQLAQKKIPFIIRRYLPDGSFQDWKLSQLKTFD